MPDGPQTAPLAPAPAQGAIPRDGGRLERRLRAETSAEVHFDTFTRGRYATDASIYQIMPIGVVVPRTQADVAATIAIAREAGVPVLPRGAGTSQCGQTVNDALVVDTSKYLRRLIHVDPEARRARVQPGIVLDHLNKKLKAHGLFFPVDVSPANRATIGGMTGNNSCGSRSIRYGNMVHNVHAVDMIMANGAHHRFGPVDGNHESSRDVDPGLRDLAARMRALHAAEADEITRRMPKLLRKVGGYNIDMLSQGAHNLAHLLVGSEGTLGFFTEIELDLSPLPAHRALGVCHFPRFWDAMDQTRHIVTLAPTAVELVDRTMIDLARDITAFRPIVDRFVRGEPDALLLVEFAGDDADGPRRDLARLVQLLADHGFPGAVVEATDPAFQRDIWDVRKAGLNIMMSMKGEGKPVSFIEDCAVPLEHLAEYTDRLTAIFRKHGTDGTWYAHASVGTLHVRPILNLKDPAEAWKMRAIAEEAFAMVRTFEGSHSGEHGDGIVRSEFHRQMFGDRLVAAFETVKDSFDPDGLFNPGRIVRPPRMDDRTLFRYGPDYAVPDIATVFDWSAWGGFGAAVEMCNNNGTCRKSDPGAMCPSYRVTLDEKHVTRGRANSLRLALSGQLGPDALASDAMADTMALCVGCKACKRECPTGVDMAKMKVEAVAARVAARGLSLRDHLVGWLPRYAPFASRIAALLNLRNQLRPLAWLGEKWAGFAADRPLPNWHARPFTPGQAVYGDGRAGEVTLWVDSFNSWFEPGNARDALRVLVAAGYRVHLPDAPDGRPPCCGRTFLAVGAVEQARHEASRTLAVLEPHLRAGRSIVGLEPSCLLSLRDELPALMPGVAAAAVAAKAVLLEEFLAAEARMGRLKLPLRALPQRRALLHGHCHQKAMGVMGPVETVLRLVPDLEVTTIDGSCCGMAGPFGYQAEHQAESRAMAELTLAPAVRAADPETLIVADGTSCRHQIADIAGRDAEHVVAILARALDT
jgi:FAD/FMN-containing dehydrogenase/Fe-S oxidoreductase